MKYNLNEVKMKFIDNLINEIEKRFINKNNIYKDEICIMSTFLHPGFKFNTFSIAERDNIKLIIENETTERKEKKKSKYESAKESICESITEIDRYLSCPTDIDDESDFDEFEKVYADFNRHIFKRLTIPVIYAPEYKKENEVDAVMDEENVKYIEVDCKNEEFRNIINFSWYLLNLINHSDESVTFYARCSYFIESNKNNHVGKKFIDTLLKGVKGNYKYELKDNSINKNYKKYFNERASIVVGENAEQIESEIQAIEERMMLQVLEQSQIIENLKNDKYTYNELRKIYNKTYIIRGKL